MDDLLPKDHLARDVWQYVEALDLAIILGKIDAVEGEVGRPATDPKIYLTLWLFATLKSINSARIIENYCREHDAFKWICGGVKVNHHSLSDFKTDHGDQLNDLLTQSVALLSKNNIISLEKVSQDGIRVRASAGSASFRREATLEEHLVLANQLVNDLNEEAEKNPGACRTRIEAAEHRAAKEKVQKIESALNELNEIVAEKEKTLKKQRKKIQQEDIKKIRVSTTDADARIMSMACKGFRPAYNVQFASTNKGKAIIGVDVLKQSSDAGQAIQMIEQVKSRYGIIPNAWMVDGGYDSHEQTDIIEEQYENCTLYMPVRTPKDGGDPHKKRAEDSKAVGELRERMGKEESKEIYRERAATAELVNAQSRNKGLQQFRVRGIDKVKCVALLYAIVQNMTIALKVAGII